MTPLPGAKSRKMVHWYDPINLAKFLFLFLRGLIFGYEDRRGLLAELDPPTPGGWEPFIDLGQKEWTPPGEPKQRRQEYWLDFIADPGDGHDAAYTIAYLSEAPELALDGLDRRLPRGDAVLFGGDLGYPIADAETLRDRLLLPYEEARLAWGRQARTMVAIPGNHDWYDNVRAFEGAFIDSRYDTTASVTRWHTPQRRSYFATRLPHNWWVLGLDLERLRDIDSEQLKYFKRALQYVDAMPEASIIIAVPDPIWHRLDEDDPPPRLTELIAEVQKRGKVKLWLSGDIHMYRHEPARGPLPHRILCGGGGAFLHPTHAARKPKTEEAEEVAKAITWFPLPGVSKTIAMRGLSFGPRNPRMLVAIAALYMLCFAKGWIGGGAIGLIVACLGFAVTQGILFSLTVGLLHGLAQAAFFQLAASRLAGVENAVYAMGLVGALIAPAMLGWYLWASLRFFRKHGTEAFSAIRSRHYKSFLRLHFDAVGGLTVYPIGVANVPRKIPGAGAGTGTLSSANAGFEFELIGGTPIKVDR